MGLLNSNVLPDNLDEPADWKGTDDDTPLMRWRIKIKYWFAFSAWPDSPQGVDVAFVLFPGLYLLPFSIWFTGFSWWYFFPLMIVPVLKRWRAMPITILGYYGHGFIRLESDNGENADAQTGFVISLSNARLVDYQGNIVPAYISRVQYWCRWHLALHWPLLITGHFYPNPSDVMPPFARPSEDEHVGSFYRGFHRDADRLYWGDGGAAGNFK